MSCAEKLKTTLATSFAFYLEAHQFHWNVESKNFVELHELFGEIYEDVHGAIDPLAEHIRALDYYAPCGFHNMADMSELNIVCGVPGDMEMVKILHDDNEVVLMSLKQAYKATEADGEVDISNYLAERIGAHNKWKWQLRSILKCCNMDGNSNSRDYQ